MDVYVAAIENFRIIPPRRSPMADRHCVGRGRWARHVTSAGACLLDGGDVDPAHRHHRLEHPLRGGAIGICHPVGQRTRGDLPRQPPPVLAPTAGAGRAAVVQNGIPQAIGFGLIVGCHLEGKGLAVREDGPAVQPDAGDAHDAEFDGQHIAFTHWSNGGTGDSATGEQVGVWQYCSEPSGAALKSFMEEYPYMDSPEPGAV